MKTRKNTMLSQTLSIFALVMFALTLTVLPQLTHTAHAQGAAYHSTSHYGMAALAEHELRLKEQIALDKATDTETHAAAIQVDRTTIQPLNDDAVTNIHKNVQERK